jgi:hypothetical protein
MWYLYTMEFYSATKKNEILSFTSKWMELENIILSYISQAQKAKNRMFSLIRGTNILNKYTKTNLVILLDIGHTLGENTREREGNPKLECG